ncbi:hypothetical protein [Lentibacillus cibarius]|uniref:Uncharacterized protein n=1 Tax=Lentibacillus cibarius TaxID=2583219 RepID=A0A5S3QN13_9BACI|nr:hypothetical protein [Lentibacillus cibarius]TMN21876.1 hypothetical protein FFL34_06925 [Lentibacillus cibarius]
MDLINKALEEGQRAGELLGESKWRCTRVLLGVIDTGNYNHIVEAVFKIYIAIQLPMPLVFLKDMNEKNYERLTLAFVGGILSE